ncbi:hypothetical protein JB92DRAFT_467149 [Gautieria morchelliformis]|nr:hypothetical protein JB92DRAFT_467149 [Gautieria morchelliformis]
MVQLLCVGLSSNRYLCNTCGALWLIIDAASIVWSNIFCTITCMSRAAKITLVGSIILSAMTVWGVHSLQEWERNRMYQGVLRDDERRRDKQRQRHADYEASQRNREVFERTQRVNDALEANNGLTSKDMPDSDAQVHDGCITLCSNSKKTIQHLGS